jgi:hypothetical protein
MLVKNDNKDWVSVIQAVGYAIVDRAELYAKDIGSSNVNDVSILVKVDKETGTVSLEMDKTYVFHVRDKVDD